MRPSQLHAKPTSVISRTGLTTHSGNAKNPFRNRPRFALGRRMVATKTAAFKNIAKYTFMMIDIVDERESARRASLRDIFERDGWHWLREHDWKWISRAHTSKEREKISQDRGSDVRGR